LVISLNERSGKTRSTRILPAARVLGEGGRVAVMEGAGLVEGVVEVMDGVTITNGFFTGGGLVGDKAVQLQHVTTAITAAVKIEIINDLPILNPISRSIPYSAAISNN
jgi:hypothetical protein